MLTGANLRALFLALALLALSGGLFPLSAAPASGLGGLRPPARNGAGAGVVAIDPGHGGREPGAVHRGSDGVVDLREKDVNLSIALRVEQLLLAQGYEPVLTRQEDAEVNVPRQDRNGDGVINSDDDLQARVDIANESGADLLLSIHHNGSRDPRVRGASTWYCAEHPRGEESREVARLLQAAFINRLTEAGYPDVRDAGFHDDAPLQKPYGHLFLVGPATPRVARPSLMPGAVGEPLYVSHHQEAVLLQNEPILDALAQAYTDAAVAFLTGQR